MTDHEERALVQLAAAMGAKVDVARARLAAAGRTAVEVVAELDRREAERQRATIEIAAEMQLARDHEKRLAVPVRRQRKDKHAIPTGWKRDRRFGTLVPAWHPDDIVAALGAAPVPEDAPRGRLIRVLTAPTIEPSDEARALAAAVAAVLTEPRGRPLATRQRRDGLEHPLADPAVVGALHDLHWRMYGHPIGHEWIGTLIVMLETAAYLSESEKVRRDHGGAEPALTFPMTASNIVEHTGAPPGILTSRDVGAMLRRVTLNAAGRGASPPRAVVRTWWEARLAAAPAKKKTRPKRR